MFVNRELQLSMLQEAYGEAESSGTVVFLLGPPGSGKTALVREFARRNGLPLLEYRCDEREMKRPYSTLKRFVSLHFPDRDYREFVSGNPAPLLSGKVVYWRNLHNADSMSLKVLRRMAAESFPGLIFVGSYVVGQENPVLSELIEILFATGNARFVLVDNLKEEDVKAWLGERYTPEVWKKTSGSPLLLSLGETYYNLSGRFGAFSSVEEAVKAILDVLGPERAEVLQAAAVVGPLFNVDILSKMLGRDVSGEVESLVSLGIISWIDHPERGRCLVFHNHRVRDALYGMVSDREMLHSLAAEAWLEVWGDEGEDDVYEMAEHMFRGGMFERAYTYARRAALICEDEADHESASYYWDMALRSLDLLPDQTERADVYSRLAEAYRAAGKLPQASGVLRRMETYARIKEADVRVLMGDYRSGLEVEIPDDDLFLRVSALMVKGSAQLRMGHYEEAVDTLSECVKAAEVLKNDKVLADSIKMLGNAYLYNFRDREAEEMYGKAMQLYEKIGDRKGIAALYNNLGIVCAQRNDYRCALDYYIKSKEIDEELMDDLGLGVVYNNIGTVYQELGEMDEAREAYEKSAYYNTLVGSMDGLCYAYSNLATLYMELCEWDRAEELLARLEKIAEKTGSVKFARIALIYRAEMLIDRCRDPTDVLEELKEKAEEDRSTMASWHHLNALYTLQRGKVEEALEHCRAAVKIMEELGRVDSTHHILLTACAAGEDLGEMERLAGTLSRDTPRQECYLSGLRALMDMREGRDADVTGIMKRFTSLGMKSTSVWFGIYAGMLSPSVRDEVRENIKGTGMECLVHLWAT